MTKNGTSRNSSDENEPFDIWAEEIPDDASVTDLCDCGHHKRKGRHPRLSSLPPQRSSEKLPETNYASTFKAVADPRPRSSKRPPMSPRNPNPPNMSFETHQRSEFKNYGEIERRKPIYTVSKQIDHQRSEFKNYGEIERRKPIYTEEHYEPPSKPFLGATSYSQEFSAKKGFPAVPVPLPKNDATLKLTGKFEDNTTAKEHYKKWPAHMTERAIPFGELPSCADSVIFPNKQPFPETTTKFSYPPKTAPRVYPIKMPDPYLQPEGEMQMMTTHQSTFKQYTGNHRPSKIERKAELKVATPQRFSNQTQFQQDYPGFKGRQPAPATIIEPPRTSVKLAYNNRRSFETEQRSIYKGHDTRQHPMRQSFKKEPEGYIQPTIKVESMSSQMRDYRPIDIENRSKLRSAVIVPKSSLSLAANCDAPFESNTSNKEFFQDWGVKPRLRYGDIHENNEYVPPQCISPEEGQSIQRPKCRGYGKKDEDNSPSNEKFHVKTTTGTTYTPKKYEGVTSYRPSDGLSIKQSSIDQEMITCYQTTYKKPKVKMCRAQMFLIQQELKKRQKVNAKEKLCTQVAVPLQSQKKLAPVLQTVPMQKA